MQEDPRALRRQLDSHHVRIQAGHRSGATGMATCLALSRAMDEALASAFSSLDAAASRHLAILAIGGYGRAELFPRSDVDVMVLCDDGPDPEAIRAAAGSFLHLLWDAGLDIGHSTRTIDEVLSLQGSTLDAWIASLESRFVCGNALLAGRLMERLRGQVQVGPDPWLIRGVFADMQARVDRYGSSVKLLEPNIKKSAGGLRDVHALVWLHRASDPAFFSTLSTDATATSAMIATLGERGVLDADSCADVQDALGFLFRVRHEMHYQRNAMHDTLEYALQQPVAEALGYGKTGELRSAEVFMSDYYRHARKIHRLNRQIAQSFRELVEPAHPAPRLQDTSIAPFQRIEQQLSVKREIRSFNDPVLVFDAFVLAAEEGMELDFRLRGAIERSLGAFGSDAPASPALALRFRRILASRNVGATLHVMNDLGVLGAYIPEFGDLVAFFQHNVYHYYTADEHTLIAISNAENLREQQGVLHDVFRMLRRKELLYLAILLHDIAKPRGVADHEITGVDVARTVLERLGFSDIFPDVGFLVRNHLVMEQTAFRRNIHDPATLREFAERFPSPPLLDYLYVLTFADLSALNVHVWTGWKSSMLQELYQRTSEVLRRNLRGEQIDKLHLDRRAAAVEKIGASLPDDVPREEVDRHVAGIKNDTYMAVFSPAEVVSHIRHARTVKHVQVEFSHTDSSTDVTIIAPDAPFALSRFCAVLAANDATIFDANIFTRDDGIIIDRFSVHAVTGGKHLDERTCTKIADEMDRIVKGELVVEQLFHEHHRRWKRRARMSVNTAIRIDVEFDDTPRFTIIDVYAPDAVGFLYRVTEAISQLGLDIYFAKIATRIDGIVDAFYVLDRDRLPVTDPARRTTVRDEILRTIRSIRELAPE